jgi:A/G-specific adenine glycosylase
VTMQKAAKKAEGQTSLTEKVVRAGRTLRDTLPVADETAQKFPWRSPRTPYRVFLAEFLLVRTRADLVARLFPELIKRYPNIHALANAEEGELAAALESLGLRKRVPYLLKGARYIVEHHKGKIPKSVEELLKVPGLGAYSAVAVAAFAHRQTEVPADVNILRFLSRLTGMPMVHVTKGSKQLWELLPSLSPDVGGPKPERLLDFSRVICRPGRPRCELCPVRSCCAFFAEVASQESDS